MASPKSELLEEREMRPEPKTLNELFNSAVERFREDELLRFKDVGRVAARSLTASSRARSASLRSAWHARVEESATASPSGPRIAPNGTMADLAVLAIGAVDVPIYSTQAAQQVEYILTDSGARAIFVSSSFLTER